MPLEAPTPLPTRASAQERARLMSLLADQLAEERLSYETFARRCDNALSARDRQHLDALAADLPIRRPLGNPLRRAVSGLSTFAAGVRSAWVEPRIPRLALPSASPQVTLGRARDCDLVLAHPTVSRHHAELRRDGDAWVLTDLSSTNGTRVNGLRISEAVEVMPGDRVSFGEMRYRLSAAVEDDPA